MALARTGSDIINKVDVINTKRKFFYYYNWKGESFGEIFLRFR